MLVPLGWLREFTPYEGTAAALGDRLTMLGLELEEIVNPFRGLEQIRVGFIAECTAHPDSDHMHCCKVDLGDGALLDIVCGAPNVAAGQKVAVAPVGATLPDGTLIKKAKLRGQPSFGMICSERELGLSEDHSGIMILPDSLDVGQTLVAALELDTEVLDLSVTPNRADCLSITGVAREVAAACGLPLHVPELPLNPDGEQQEMEVPVAIEEGDLCWLYAGRVVSGAKVGPSPLKFRCRLRSVGVRAINNIVDVTNYVLFECGQPLHSFDLDKLAGGRIIVRRAGQGETLVTLDGKERLLVPEDLCICDTERAVALAGVMGGLNTEITADSQNVFLESAVFNPRNIRKTSRRLGLQSEASYRFERGVDQHNSIRALDRACSLMASLAGGVVRRGFSISEPRPFVPVKITYNPAGADRLLGVEITPDAQMRTLSSLGCAVEDKGDHWFVIQPSWRPDLTREADVIEEVGRVYGLDRIEPALPPVQRKLDDDLAPHTAYDFGRLVKQWGAGLGLHEAINYSFVGARELDQLGLPAERRLRIFNPLSEEQDTLRTALAPGLLRDLANNLAFGAQSVRLFELANAFESDSASETGAVERPLLGVLLSGLRHERWPHREADFDYADIKGVLESLTSYLHLSVPELRQEDNHPYLLPCASIHFAGNFCGCMGRLKPAIADLYNAQKTVWLCELDLSILRRLHSGALVRFRALPVYPPVRRDITASVDKKIRAETILEKIMLLKLPDLEGAVLRDCFEAAGEKTRNLTFRLTFRNDARTLKDSEVDRQREEVADYLRAELGAQI